MDSRRPSDPVRVPETLEETDSLNYEEECWKETPCTLPCDDPVKGQWHRDRWLSDDRHKPYSDKSTDVDSGTEMTHISESECEECMGLLHQNSITSSSSAGAILSHKRASYSHNGRLVSNSFSCDSSSECSCPVHHYSFKNNRAVRNKSDNNDLRQDFKTANQQNEEFVELDEDESDTLKRRVNRVDGKFYEEENEESIKIPLTATDNVMAC